MERAHVLVVEDSPVMRMLIARALGRMTDVECSEAWLRAKQR